MDAKYTGRIRARGLYAADVLSAGTGIADRILLLAMKQELI
jgi:hypothetical protein